jgi:tetratricopeptide (TPR) repeat protein
MRHNHSIQRFDPVLSALRGIAFALLSSTTLFAQSTGAPAAQEQPAQSSSAHSNPAEQPAFDDEPHFSVSGVKDASALGGHGSDTIVRARNSLAKETVSLGKNDAPDAVSAATLELLRQRAEREPGNAAVHHRLADAEEKLGDSLAAVHEYQRAAELEPREDYFFDWGSELLLHHAPEPAIEVFTKGAQSSPKSARMLIGLGAAEYALGNSDQAVKEIGAASDLNPSDPIPYLFLGKMLGADTTPSDALTEKLRRFVSLQPDRADANYYYALALWKRRNDSPASTAASAKSLLNRAIELDAKYSAAYLQRGILYAEEADDVKAIADYQKAISIDSRSQDAHLRLAQAYRRIGDNDKAKAEIETYEALAKESEVRAERERHEIPQFVYTLRDKQPLP